MRELDTLVSVLGAENVDDLRKGIKELLLDKLRDDLYDYSEYLISPPDIKGVVEETVEKTKKQLMKMYKDAVIEINQDYIDKMKAYMSDQFDGDTKLRHDVFDLAKKYYWQSNEYGKERKFAEELMKILKITEADISKEKENGD